MVDAEVVRLRRMRDAALRARQLAVSMGADSRDIHSVLSRTTVACWRLACVATGRLRAHPYVSYQRDRSRACIVRDRVVGFLLGGIARYRGHMLGTLAAQLRQVERELNDTRALTSHPDLGDTLGRCQAQIKKLLKDVTDGAVKEANSRRAAPSKQLRPGHQGAASVSGDWPYIAL